YASNAAPAPFTPPGSFPRKRGKRSKSAPSVTARQLPPLRRGSETNPFPRRRGKRNQSLPLRSGIEHGPQAGRGWPLGTKPIEIPSPQAGEAEQNPHQPLRVDPSAAPHLRSEEHTSELQSRENLVCRLLLEKKKPGDGRRR